MAFKSSKHRHVIEVSNPLNGGLNLAQSPANIGDNELRRTLNFIYDPQTDYLMTRPGTVCQTAARCDGVQPLLRGYYYEQGPSTGFHVCACNGNLYYLSGVNLDTWTLIGALYTAATTPAFLTYNNKLLIADGGGIKTWDGTTLTQITGAPKATALKVVKGRVVANAVDEPDSVYFSAPHDAESADAWNTTKNAIGIRAGYGDMLSVNGFEVLGNDVIVSKVGKERKRLYRVNVSASDPSTWYAQNLSENNAAQNAHTMISAWNNVFFVDTNGFKSLAGTDTYGDLEVDSVGRKVNTLFIEGYTCDFITYLPSYNTIWFNILDRVFCYTERYDPASGSRIPAITDLSFLQGRITSAYEANDTVYLTGYNGYLYRLSETAATDEVAPSDTRHYVSIVRTKTHAFLNDAVLRKLQWYLKPKMAGQGNLYAVKEMGDLVLLKTITTLDAGQELYEATHDLYEANEELYSAGAASWVETSRSRTRGIEMAFEIEMVSGRVGVEWCKAEIALLEGGE